MIIRIVVLYFNEDDGDRFLTLFRKHESDIRHFEGCRSLRVMRLAGMPGSYATWSHWSSEQALHTYRDSPLFQSVWEQLRPLFIKPPQAFSFEPIH